MADILKDIIATKRTEVAAARAARPLPNVRAAALAAPSPRSFLAALAPGSDPDLGSASGDGSPTGGSVSTATTATGATGSAASPVARPYIIAECKQRSPSRGQMVAHYDPVALAKAYVAGGAAAISVLTDKDYFGGALAHMTAVRHAVDVPVLRKDFIIDEYQIHEARAAGADTFLLLSGVLTTDQLQRFLDIGRSLGMEPLIESHTAAELTAALATSGRIFGINNRDLRTFGVDLQTSRSLATLAGSRSPPAILVCESGIKTPADVSGMRAAGFTAFLVGEAVATAPSPEAAVRALIG